jgi:hypothetical protein
MSQTEARALRPLRIHRELTMASPNPNCPNPNVTDGSTPSPSGAARNDVITADFMHISKLRRIPVSTWVLTWRRKLDYEFHSLRFLITWCLMKKVNKLLPISKSRLMPTANNTMQCTNGKRRWIQTKTVYLSNTNWTRKKQQGDERNFSK